MKSFLQWNKSAIVSTIASVASIFLAMLANQLYSFFVNEIDSESDAGIKIFLFVSICIFTIVAIFFVTKISDIIKSKIWPEYKDDQYMKHAFLKIRQLGSNRQKCFQEAQKCTNQVADVDFLVQETMQNMQLVVESCYDFFESAFTITGQLQEPIKFESTFMTLSYRDNEITIPCSANKERRTPPSMLLREKNVKIFENTETAKIYKKPSPKMILVENTQENNDYAETYDNQKARIKSSIILPVKSHENALLGTLVVHCNQSGFFKMSRYDFWNELLELFSVELGYHKLFLDSLVKDNPDAEKPF